ncbi:MAG: MBL fold metallo-hydrolase, partial [Actinomycetota bacterium]|nr:MBL fold metallo-hydrolase [Actinomycetota bacterium]
MRVHVCGVRGSTPAPGADFVRYGGHTSCLALSHDGEAPSLVLDAGTGLRRVSGLLDGAAFRGAVLLGHLHWDHTQGLPFFAGGDRPDARVRLCLPDQGDPVEVLSRFMSPPHFPIPPTALRGTWTFEGLAPGVSEIEGFTVLALEIPHKGGRTFGFRVSDGTGVVAYLSDHSPVSLGPGPDGLGPYHDAALALAEGADLVFHDAQHTAEELPARAHFGHSAAPYAVGLAAAAGARSVLLY